MAGLFCLSGLLQTGILPVVVLAGSNPTSSVCLNKGMKAAFSDCSGLLFSVQHCLSTRGALGRTDESAGGRRAC